MQDTGYPPLIIDKPTKLEYTVIMAYKDGSRQTGGRAYRQSQSLKEFVRKRDNYTCRLCGKPGNCVDHIKPWQVSHDSTLSNLCTLCLACNLATRRQRKDASPFKTIDDYYAYLKREIEAGEGSTSPAHPVISPLI